MADRTTTGDAIVHISDELTVPLHASPSTQNNSAEDMGRGSASPDPSESDIWKEYRKIDDWEGILKSSTSFPYFQKLDKLMKDQIEIQAIKDFYEGTRHYGKQVTEDTIHVIQIPHTGQPMSSDLNCSKQADVQKLQSTLNSDDQSLSIAAQVIVVQDLSPVLIELLGHELQIPHRVFVNFIWTQNYEPFWMRNPCAYNQNVNLEPLVGTLTMDCDVNLYHDSNERYDANKIGEFLPSFKTTWPNGLSDSANMGRFKSINTNTMDLYGMSRITIHHFLSPKSVSTGKSKLRDHLLLANLNQF